MLRVAVDTIGRICEKQNSGVGLGLFVASAVLAVGTRKFTTQSKGSAIRKHWSWLEGEHNFLKDVLGEEALSFVKDRNQHSIKALGDPTASPLYDKVLSILDSSDKIPFLRKINDMYYNFWQDKANPRGLWRRTTMESYMSKSPVWEVVLDFDELGRQEGESWVYKGHTIYEPDYHPDPARRRVTRTMLQLSRGGADAVVLREFDLDAKAFVTDRPFLVPESKSRVAWKSLDTLYIGKICGW
jgi:prolyl oligopeptidase